ncbi:MAG TPA: PEPxxWA-CTERM sorting domain-containing protein [Polymorphobacter sp.]|nr:PEPxxWA-CTERM sorting domain-containing protein [Polymorphobacter sp.]
MFSKVLVGALALAAAVPAAAVNVVYNGDFDYAGYAPTLTTAVGTGGPSAAPGWNTWQNSGGSLATALLPSTDTLLPGGPQMLEINTTGLNNGVYQFLGTFQYLAADFLILSGQVQLVATGDYGAHAGVVYGSASRHWQRLYTSWAGSNEIAIYSYNGPAHFYVDNVYAGDVPGPTPTPGVPEPASWALMIAGFGMVGSALRRRRIAVA